MFCKYPLYTVKATLQRKESFPFPPASHFSSISVKTKAEFCAETEMDPKPHWRNIAILRTMEHLLSPLNPSHEITLMHPDTPGRAGIADCDCCVLSA